MNFVEQLDAVYRTKSSHRAAMTVCLVMHRVGLALEASSIGVVDLNRTYRTAAHQWRRAGVGAVCKCAAICCSRNRGQRRYRTTIATVY